MWSQGRGSGSAAAWSDDMPIALCSKGDSGRIRKIQGEDGVQRHLRSLGFAEGVPITVVSRLFGSVIVDVRGSRIALDESMARSIIIG